MDPYEFVDSLPQAPAREQLEPIVQLDETGRFLIRVARRLESGWCQHVQADTGGRFCLIGALRYEASLAHKDPQGVYGYPTREAREAAARIHQACGEAIEVWNDTPGRTQQDVVDLVVRAAYNT